MASNLKIGGKTVSSIEMSGKAVKLMLLNGKQIYISELPKLGYAPDGLKFMFDGIENTDAGHSSGTVSSWKNLGDVDTLNAIAPSGMEFGDNYLKVRGSTATRPYISGSIMTNYMRGEWTVQMYCSIADARQMQQLAGFFGNHGAGRGLVGGQQEGTWAWALYSPTFVVWRGDNSEYPPIGQKFLVTMTSSMTNGRMKLYIDLDKKAEVAASNVPLTQSSDFYLGAAHGNADRVGWLDIYNVRIYDRELTDAEIESNYLNDKKRFRVDPSDLSTANIKLDKSYVIYDGTPQIPEFEVYDANGDLLVEDVDFTASAIDNVDIGVATLTISGIGQYRNTKSTTFYVIDAPDYTDGTEITFNNEFTFTAGSKFTGFVIGVNL